MLAWDDLPNTVSEMTVAELRTACLRLYQESPNYYATGFNWFSSALQNLATVEDIRKNFPSYVAELESK